MNIWSSFVNMQTFLSQKRYQLGWKILEITTQLETGHGETYWTWPDVTSMNI